MPSYNPVAEDEDEDEDEDVLPVCVALVTSRCLHNRIN
jgi:hypothetical protein